MIRTILTHTLVMAGLLMAVPATAQKDTLKNKLNLDMTLGHSFEFMLSYTFTQDIKLTLGYTHMLGTETMARLKKEGQGSHANWGWFSLVITPKLFSTKW